MRTRFFLAGLLSVFICCSSWQESALDRAHKDKLIEVAKRVYDSGLTFGTGGDISVRVEGMNRFIIKGTGNCLGDLDHQKLATLTLDGELMEGSPQPSHEADIHRDIYRLRESVGAIMHIHAPYATAWATAGRVIPAVTQQSVNLLRSVAIIPYYPVESQELIDAVLDTYQNHDTQVVMMQNHGVFVVGSDLYDLLYKGEVVENTARIAYFCETLGTPVEFDLPDLE